MDDKTDCSDYRGYQSYQVLKKTVCNILLSRLSSYIGEIIGDLQCGFRRNRPTNAQIIFIHQILEKIGVK
jgi:hypothetical protein